MIIKFLFSRLLNLIFYYGYRNLLISFSIEMLKILCYMIIIYIKKIINNKSIIVKNNQY